MTNKEKYISAFTEAFSISEDAAIVAKYQEEPSWDSIGHMTLISLLEESFDIMMDTDDIIDFSSFKKGMEIMQKYDVEI
jgi:acyl carrier protein